MERRERKDRAQRGHRGTKELFVEFARTRDPDLREVLITANLKLAYSRAHRFAKTAGEGRNVLQAFDDIQQEALRGLIHAVDGFDPARGFEFSTFAVRTIDGYIMKFLNRTAATVKVPANRNVHRLAAERARQELTVELHRAPTLEELSQRTGMTTDALRDLERADRAQRALSFDGAADDESLSLHEVIADPGLGAEGLVVELEFLRSVLSEEDVQLFVKRHVAGMNAEELAVGEGVSGTAVRKRLRDAKARLRDEVGVGI